MILSFSSVLAREDVCGSDLHKGTVISSLLSLVLEQSSFCLHVEVFIYLLFIYYIYLFIFRLEDTGAGIWSFFSARALMA